MTHKSSLNDYDIEAIQDAVGLLNAAGFEVNAINDVEPEYHGVEFGLTLTKNTRTKPMGAGDGDQ